MHVKRLPAVVGVLLGALSGAMASASAADSVSMPYDRTCPVIYDNDGAIESGYTDVYMMALASARTIVLKGIITTCSYGEERRKPPFSPVPGTELARERQELVEKARRSGLRNLPGAETQGGAKRTFQAPFAGDAVLRIWRKP
jgi:hypothetical protein